MSARETPLQQVKRIYGSKDKLVAAVAKGLDGLEAGGDDLESRLATSPNARLLRLASVVESVKTRYGSKDKLIAAIATAQGKAKDNDYREKLADQPLPRLLDLATSSERRARRSKAA
jgi:hypothetical protein